jgi:thioredoxin reductase
VQCFYIVDPIPAFCKGCLMAAIKDVAIVGAGPYGLSIAAYLRKYGLDYAVVGKPMETWLSKMPRGMSLKSPGFSSNLLDPDDAFTLRHFCEARGIPYKDIDFPIPVETFCAYGMAFQDRFVPELIQDDVISVALCPEGFELRTARGTIFKSRKVVIAVGIDYFRHTPEPLAALPRHLCSHSAEHQDVQRFKGREVAVLGSGSSAVDLAVLLYEAGAAVRQVVRRPALDFGDPWRPPSLSMWHSIRTPISGIGPGWRSWLYTHVPSLYRCLPDKVRLNTVKTHLGPSAGWFMRERAASVPLITGTKVLKAKEHGERVELHLANRDGGKKTLLVDHIIAATGFENDVRRLPFLPTGILNLMDLIGYSPRLSLQFESSISGLHFAGPIAAASFGPVMRFVAGADVTCQRISAHLARTLRAKSYTEQRSASFIKSP